VSHVKLLSLILEGDVYRGSRSMLAYYPPNWSRNRAYFSNSVPPNQSRNRACFSNSVPPNQSRNRACFRCSVPPNQSRNRACFCKKSHQTVVTMVSLVKTCHVVLETLEKRSISRPLPRLNLYSRTVAL
jgi:hypothetical protein